MKLVRSRYALRVLGGDSGGDLREAGVVRDERERSGGGRLGGDHAERLGEDRRDRGDVGQGDQLRQVPVLERPGEERARRSRSLELLAVVAEADDDGPRVDVPQRLEEDVHALVPQELAEVEDGRLVLGEERLEPVRVPLVGQPLVRVAGVRRIGPALGDQVAQRLVARAAGRTRRRRRPAGRRARGRRGRRPRRAPCGCAPSRRRPPRRPRATLSPTRDSSSFPRIEYSSSRAVRLDRVPGPRRRRHGPAEHDVVREHEVGRQMRPERFGVRRHVALAFVRGQVLHETHIHALVLVEHEGGQQPADVRADDGRPAEVVFLRVRLLREHGHVVAGAAPLARERARVHVRPGPAEQVPVPEQDAHRDIFTPAMSQDQVPRHG